MRQEYNIKKKAIQNHKKKRKSTLLPEGDVHSPFLTYPKDPSPNFSYNTKFDSLIRHLRGCDFCVPLGLVF